MEEMFQNPQLRQILDLKLRLQGFQATDQAKNVALEMLNRARNRPQFSNAGEIDIILDATKIRHQARVSSENGRHGILEANDFDLDFDRAERSDTNVRMLFKGTVGSDDTVTLLEGTGKTTTARKIGKVFYDMGFLAEATVKECSASDLIAPYVDGGYGKEAMDELVDSVTKERYYKKLIIILAGYEKDINNLMTMNEGLTSRFPTVIEFRALKPTECIALLSVDLSLEIFEAPTMQFAHGVEELFSKLADQASWASARDVQLVAKGIQFHASTGGSSKRPIAQVLFRHAKAAAVISGITACCQSRNQSLTPEEEVGQDVMEMP
ncbi:stage V sporulation protein K [Hirsutella rhossiliensis]|uniref:Stage V sporulation protein K n=1 Tax=Hirsutella rhossiliensis TaxID=111463 RepID=A0A9P8SJ61_9HYPO|nr:stage V sporulation protein K [Hirsutella rhossiliensis]KAH0963889.1 stage V sporulation protein K [Hirsutella rhossiliensis]